MVTTYNDVERRFSNQDAVLLEDLQKTIVKEVNAGTFDVVEFFDLRNPIQSSTEGLAISGALKDGD